MSWQLWVVIALVATGVVVLAVTRMRHAQHVFDDIVQPDRPMDGSRPGHTGDEIARARARAQDRARRNETESSPRRGHG